MSDQLTAVTDLLADPRARKTLIDAVAVELKHDSASGFWRRARPFLAGASSALVVLLAFLIPSLQDQWDRYSTRGAVDRYEAIGAALMEEGQFESAERAFARAVELAGNQRHDLFESQIRARVMRIYDNPDWRSNVPESVDEADFLYLLQSQKANASKSERAATLAAYGAFLASRNRLSEAEMRLSEALTLDSASADAHIHLGNVYDDLNKSADAEREYRRALAIEPNSSGAHYNLGILLLDQKRAADAAQQFSAITQRDPRNVDAQIGLIESLEAQGKRTEALNIAMSALALNRESADLRAAIERLKVPVR
jgi:Flp pilus assembly protein TadD